MRPVNLILLTDSYKHSHPDMFPPDTQLMSYYIESRGGEYQNTVWALMQLFITDYLLTPITTQMIDEAALILEPHGEPFNRERWDYIVERYDGYLPIEIQSVPEGTVIPVHNVLAQYMATDENCYWLAGHLETMMLRAAWYGTTIATKSFHCKQILQEYFSLATDNISVDFGLHDFGARGVSSHESAEIGGAAHLINFMGSDTLECLPAIKRAYGEVNVAKSIPASEHSAVTSWGRDNEQEVYKHILNLYLGKGKTVAIVGDSYNVWDAIKIFGTTLKEQIVNSGGRVVFRPDSGDPIELVSLLIESLMDYFGYELNSKGYKVLPSYIRLIQGDGITESSMKEILQNVIQHNISPENVSFGMGGGLLQHVNRDTLKFACKCSAIKRNGLWYDVYKDPITDPGKRSKRGRLALIVEDGEYKTIRETELNGRKNVLQTVYRNGELLIIENFENVRKRALSGCSPTL